MRFTYWIIAALCGALPTATTAQGLDLDVNRQDMLRRLGRTTVADLGPDDLSFVSMLNFCARTGTLYLPSDVQVLDKSSPGVLVSIKHNSDTAVTINSGLMPDTDPKVSGLFLLTLAAARECEVDRTGDHGRTFLEVTSVDGFASLSNLVDFVLNN